MAIFSRRTVFLLLVGLVLVSFALRYPMIEHERYQTDSYFIHLISQSVVDEHQAIWAFHPLSYFGLYPYSYPSGIPILLAELSQMTGLSMEVCILLYDFALAAVFCLAVFILTRHFIVRSEYALLATFFAITAARFVDTTYWNGSARGTLIVLVTLLVFASFRAAMTRQPLLLLVSGLLAFGCLATHHMAVLLILYGVAYVIAAFEVQYLLRKVKIRKRAAAATFNTFVVASIVIATFSSVGFFGKMLATGFRATWLFDIEPAILSILLNIGASYANQIGLVFIIALFGIVVIHRDLRISMESLFPMTLVLVMIPLLGNSLYISMLISPFVAIVAILWLKGLYRSTLRKKLAVALIVLLVISSIAIPVWSLQKWNRVTYVSGDTVSVGGDFFNDVAYLNDLDHSIVAIGSSNVLLFEMDAHSRNHFLGSGIRLVIAGDVTRDDIKRNITWSTAEFPVNLYIWYEYVNEPRIDFYLSALVIRGMNYLVGPGSLQEAVEYYQKHPKFLIAIDLDHPNDYVDVYSIRQAKFPDQLDSASWVPVEGGERTFPSYLIYSSERNDVFMVHLPI